jgi:hypothetical protein
MSPDPVRPVMGHWAEDVFRKAKQVFGSYLFNINRRVHACESVTSYECAFGGSLHENVALGDEDVERLEAEIRAGDAGTGATRSIH